MEVIVLLVAAASVIAFLLGRRSHQAGDLTLRIESDGIDWPGTPRERDRDAWEGGFWDASDPRDVSARLAIKYTDGNGSPSERTVRVRSFDPALYGGTMIGHCELRNDTRAFRFDRIREAVDTDTGEVVSDVGDYLQQRYDASPERSRDTLREDYRQLLRVLFYVAKADGQYRREEKEVVRRYLRSIVNDPRVSDELIDGLFQDLEVPTLPAFKRALGKVLSEQLVEPASLKNVCHEIVATQQKVSPGEKEALEYLERRISRER